MEPSTSDTLTRGQFIASAIKSHDMTEAEIAKMIDAHIRVVAEGLDAAMASTEQPSQATEAPVELAKPGMLTITNHHSVKCGTPPDFRVGEANFISYFQSDLNDQWVIRYQDGQSAQLWGGDIGWEEPREVDTDTGASGLILSLAERTWLQACCFAITGIKNNLRLLQDKE